MTDTHTPNNNQLHTTMTHRKGKKKITTDMVLQWIGEDSMDDMATVLEAIANGDYKPEELRDDIESTCD